MGRPSVSFPSQVASETAPKGLLVFEGLTALVALGQSGSNSSANKAKDTAHHAG